MSRRANAQRRKRSRGTAARSAIRIAQYLIDRAIAREQARADDLDLSIADYRYWIKRLGPEPWEEPVKSFGGRIEEIKAMRSGTVPS